MLLISGDGAIWMRDALRRSEVVEMVICRAGIGNADAVLGCLKGIC